MQKLKDSFTVYTVTNYMIFFIIIKFGMQLTIVFAETCVPLSRSKSCPDSWWKEDDSFPVMILFFVGRNHDNPEHETFGCPPTLLSHVLRTLISCGANMRVVAGVHLFSSLIQFSRFDELTSSITSTNHCSPNWKCTQEVVSNGISINVNGSKHTEMFRLSLTSVYVMQDTMHQTRQHHCRSRAGT